MLYYPTFVPQNNEPYFAVYPNPATGRFRIYTGTKDNRGRYFRIMDMTGRIVYSGNLEQKETLIDISDQAKGFYMVTIITEKGKKTEKLVLQ